MIPSKFTGRWKNLLHCVNLYIHYTYDNLYSERGVDSHIGDDKEGHSSGYGSVVEDPRESERVCPHSPLE